MKYIFNPFTTLPYSLCDDRLPAFPSCQDGTGYAQYLSQISGLILLPITAPGPADWTNEDNWLEVIQNDDLSGEFAKAIVVKGSFLPQNTTEIQISGGRAQETRARLYRFSGSAWNLHSGHINLARHLQENNRAFYVWLQTLDKRLIGGQNGMRPFFVDADIPFSGGNEDRERIDIAIDFYLHSFPDSEVVDFEISDESVSVYWQQEDLANWMGELAESDWQGE